MQPLTLVAYSVALRGFGARKGLDGAEIARAHAGPGCSREHIKSVTLDTFVSYNTRQNSPTLNESRS